MDNFKDREEFWRDIASNYHETNTGFAKEQREFIARAMVKNNIQSVLELGCNTGGNLLYINKASPTIKIVGVDINERALKYGKEVEKNPAELIAGSLYDLAGFADKSFDVVFTRGVLLHVNDIKVIDVIRDMIRISKYFVFNIERNGSEKILSYGSNKQPHAFSHDFKSIYDRLSQPITIQTMESLTHRPAKGGADNFVLAELTNKKFIM